MKAISLLFIVQLVLCLFYCKSYAKLIKTLRIFQYLFLIFPYTKIVNKNDISKYFLILLEDFPSAGNRQELHSNTSNIRAKPHWEKKERSGVSHDNPLREQNTTTHGILQPPILIGVRNRLL